MKSHITYDLSTATVAFASGKYEEALNECQKLIGADVKQVNVFSLAGNSCIMLEKLSEAEDFFNRAIELDNQNGDLYFYLGHSQYGQDKYADALSSYAKADQLGCSKENQQKLYYLMGVISQSQGKKEAALINYHKATDSDISSEDQRDIILNTIQLYMESDELPEAEKYAIQYKLLCPDEFACYQLLFQIYLAEEKFTDAQNILREATEYCQLEGDNKIKMLFDQVMLLCCLAENDDANKIKNFEQALNILNAINSISDLSDANKFEVIVSKAEIFIQLGRKKEALESIKEIASKPNSDDAEKMEYIERARLLLTEMLLENEEYEDARKYARMLNTSNNPTYKYQALYSEAYATKKLSKAQPEQKEAVNQLYERAIAYLRSYCASAPNDLLAFLYRAKAYADIGEYDKAREMCGVLPEEAQQMLEEYINNCQIDS